MTALLLLAASVGLAAQFDEIPWEVNGRPVEAFWQKGDPERGEEPDVRNLVLVEHPKPGTPERGRPLYVVLHSAGHDVLSTLQCTRTRGDHDIYHSPEDFFALYLDCRANSDRDWWWGARDRKGIDEVPCERRVVDTVRWAISRYGIDTNRVYLCGNSMGGSGTLGIGLRHGEIFAAIKANVPAISRYNHPVQSLGLNLPEQPSDLRLADPPVMVDYSAPNDGWSVGHELLIDGLRKRRYSHLFFWGPYGHANDHAKIAELNDIIHRFDWLSVRLDEPYPVFTGATSDTPSPWPDDRENANPGQINGFFRWENAHADANEVALELRLATDAELKSRHFKAPTDATAAVTLRRLGAFAVKPRDRLLWRFGKEEGVLTVGADALVTIPSLKITQEKHVLRVFRPSR